MLVLAPLLILAAASWIFENQLNAGPPSPPGFRAEATAETVQQGAYMARLGNCAGCHTARGGQAYAGGRAVPTPFGNVYAGNLTPDDETGLGRWSADDFWRALHLGRARDGRWLLPAFPYPHYSHVTRADSDALHAYLRSLAPMSSVRPAHALHFPYNSQAALAVWRLLFFRPAAPVAAQVQRTPLERGAYLVQGLGHCGACHAPHNAWGAAAEALTGADMPGQRWHAPSLLPASKDPAALEQTVVLLKTGGSALGRASGPMAAVVGSSLQHWSDADLHAAVQYLHSLPVVSSNAADQVRAPSGRSGLTADQRLRGAKLYTQHCADCHGEAGESAAAVYPALAGNATVLQATALNLVQVITHGGFGPTTAGNPRPYGMPPFVFSDADMAAVVNHVRQSWGNDAAAVSELDVLRLR